MPLCAIDIHGAAALRLALSEPVSWFRLLPRFRVVGQATIDFLSPSMSAPADLSVPKVAPGELSPALVRRAAAGEELAAAVRAAPSSSVGAVLVAGPSAELVDTKSSIIGRIPLAGLLIALSTFVVLFLSFGSLLVPAKAVVLNLLSLTATFGAMVWIFQDGHLSGLLGVTATGSLAATMPILMFCIAFGLSMDYEVFLLSRVKEEHDRSGDNTRSVALGLERTGRIVTVAALLIAVVFASFAITSGVSFMKLFGVGLTMAVIMDATLIRAALVPAFMKLAGEANWWAPAPLKRFYDRYGISDHTELPDVASEPMEVAAR